MLQCTACEKQLSKKEVVYTENKDPYCVNPYTCNENHPNSVQNVLARGNAIQMFNEKELDRYKTEQLDLTIDEKDQINRIITKPMTVRINQVPLAYYLLQVKEEYGLGSLSESIRLCVEKMSEIQPIGIPLTTQERTETKEETDIPKPELPPTEPEVMKEEKPEEDDMTF